mgnify:CR=1 FL=1
MRDRETKIKSAWARERKIMITTKEIKERFERTSGGMLQGIDIITDKQTGVEYLVNNYGSSGGITPLIDKNGKPIITSNTSDKGNINPF